MEHRPASLVPRRDEVICLLETHVDPSLDRAAHEALATAIMPYLERTRLPLANAVPKIAINYRRDGHVVRQLSASLTNPEWGEVLEWIMERAAKHSQFPNDGEAVGAPDIDAYEDIRKKLHLYNFEGPFKHWLTVTVVSRISRYWRDRQTLSAGGHGIKLKAERQEAKRIPEWRPAPNASNVSLDWLLECESNQTNRLIAHNEAVAGIVEASELNLLVAQELKVLARVKNDPLLLSVWHASVVQGLKLREAAEVLGLTVSQVYRRVEQARQHLRHNPTIRKWCDAHLL